MSALSNLKVGPRLAAGFGTLLLLILAMLAVMLYSTSRTEAQFEQVVDINMHKIELLNGLLDTNNELLMHRRLMLIKRGEDLDTDFAHAQQLTDKYNGIWSTFLPLPRDQAGDTHVQAILQARALTDESNATLDAAMRRHDFDAAIAILLNELRPRAMAWNKTLDDYIDYQSVLTVKTRDEYLAMADRTRVVVIAFTVFSLVLGVVIAWTITRSLTQPLASAAAAAHALARGHLDVAMPRAGKDEVGDVIRAIQQSRSAITLLRDGLDEITTQHGNGMISFRSDTSGLHGEYRRLGDAFNALLEEHSGAALLAGELADRYARGDLSQDFPRVPGEKAILMRAMDNVKASITRINHEILHLSQAAVRGDFSVRGDHTQFEFGFRDMVMNLNQLMATSDNSLASLSSVLKDIAQGNLTVRMEGEFHGVFAQMRDDANATVKQLNTIVGGIQQAASAIRLSASELSSGNAELSQRTEQQAANLEETAASMEEMTSTVRQNADSAQQANQLAISAHRVASQGGEITRGVVATMGQIQTSSRRIADIISVIDGIAFQTNILALNAAVEAARAGEQGRGFAVVASEVRTLAQRSAGAAKEIKELIDDSVNKVTTGSQLVHEAGKTMEDIVSSVQQVTAIMAEISAASQEQTAGIEQVNQTIVHMDQSTQQNAALVEEASAAARAMEDQARHLSSAVAAFTIDIHATTDASHA